MRKITQEAIGAFLLAVSFNKSNTEVSVNEGKVVLKLHGNPIAKYTIGKFNSTLEVSDGGWKTNTTKERLNGIPDVNVCQKKGIWYLNGKEWDGSFTKIINN